VTEQWTSSAATQEHPGVVPFYQCFVAQRAIFFVHQYIPGARSLQEHLGGGSFPEQLLWSCIVQLVSAIRTVHASKVAVRTLKLQHILSNSDSMGSRLRLRLNCVGVIDTLEFESRKQVSDLQERDIRDLGRIIMSLATGSEVTAATDDSAMGQCEDFLAQNYSRDMHNLAMTLIRSNPRPPSILDVSRAITQHVFDEQDAAYASLDRAEQALSVEYESGRGLRLLLKLGFINERPELGPNRRWAQSPVAKTCGFDGSDP
jgi:PAB-dependent poly(A)-specific ribonuclease subunit 3